MGELLSNAEFWKAITSLAWPIAALILFFSLRKHVAPLFRRDNLTIKVAGLEVSVKDAAESLGTQVADLQSRLADLELSSIASNSEETSKLQNSVVEDELETNSAKILLWVDDYPSNNAFIIEKLRGSDIEVVLSLSTEEALEKIQKINPTAIISDLGRMENGSDNPFAGLDLLRKMRSEDMKIPTLIFAGKRGLANKKKLVAAGAVNVTASGVDVMRFIEQELET